MRSTLTDEGMHAFEVTVPDTDGSGGSAITMVIRADHWMEAWKQALAELGEGATDAAQVTCKIGSDGSVEVVALGSGRKVLVRSIPDEADEPLPQERPAVEVDEAQKVTRLSAPIVQPRVERPDSRRGQRTTIQDAPRARAKIGPKLRRGVRRQRAQGVDDPVGVVPYVRPVAGGTETSTEEALDMLRRHVSCDVTQFLLPDPEGKGWRVEVSRGQKSSELGELLLRTKEPIPGPVDGGPGRRTFAGAGVPVKYVKNFARRTTVRVKSALWAPVKDGYRVLGLLLLLNARRSHGFTDAELSAVRELADLLAARFRAAGR